MRRLGRAAVHAAIMLLALGAYATVYGGQAPPAYAHHVTQDDVIALATERAEAWGASPARVLSIIRCETGGKMRPDYPDGRLLVGSSGELGVGQWLRGGAWESTPQSRVLGINVRALYQNGDPEALFWDVDGLAWAFSPKAPRGMQAQWSCA